MITFKHTPIKDFMKNNSPTHPTKEAIESFSNEIELFLQKALTRDDEEFQKNEINKFLGRVYGYDCNTKGSVDSAIYIDGEAQVLIEAKALKNKSEFPKDTPLSKALYESILYFLREKIIYENNSIKHIILCNPYDFYVFGATSFEMFQKDKKIKKLYDNCDGKEGTDKSTKKFFEGVEKHLKGGFEGELAYTHFSLKNKLSTQELTAIYQLLSPQVLLEMRKTLDANTLNKNFYEELLYILGLKEESESGKSGGKILIKPSKTPNTLSSEIERHYKLSDEEIFTLLTTWNNRILFLRLLESMLKGFHHIQKEFLDIGIIQNFKTLQTLFFEVLAKKTNERSPSLPKELINIPYLNSSLFDPIALEREGKHIGGLDSAPLALFSRSILKKDTRFKDKEALPLLEYLFEFLHAYDFTTTPKDIEQGVKQNHDRLINSAVLGLVFEKLNGYKEGSFYTPSFITSYMCKESITEALIQKYNSTYKWEASNLKDIISFARSDKIPHTSLLSTLLSLRICDPAVGSGHFLVSALNEMVLLCYELGLLTSLPLISTLELENDEILIKTHNELFAYTRPSSPQEPNHKIQVELFNLKKSIIENCLFGVDINPNSCEITKLRLWIELLKYSYYIFDEKGKNTNALETLPNIDINIKCGNSLISRFSLDDNLNKIKNIKKKIQEYKDLVAQYKDPNPLYPLDKTQLTNKILELKVLFSLTLKDPKTKAELEKAIKKHIEAYNDFALDDESLLEGLSIGEKNLFGTPELSPKEEEEAFASYGRIRALRKKLDNALSGEEYTNAFEWRFEFPEVLDEEGNFKGFDCIIGNPPYIKEGGNKELFTSTKALRTYQGKMDIWYHFVGRALELLKQNGELSFIATNNWTTNAGAKKLRNILLEESQFISLIDFGAYKVFESADIQTMIMRFKKLDSPQAYSFDYRKIIATKPNDTHRIALLQMAEYEGNLYFNAKVEKEKLINKALTFSTFDSIFASILKNDILFLDEKEITNGIHPHYDRISKKINEKFFNQFLNGEGIFVLSEAEKNHLRASERELKFLKPFYETSEVMKYFTFPQNKYWVIYTDSSFKNPNSMDDYPKLKQHLDRFKEVITSDNKPYGLHRARDERFFTGSPRIIALRKCAKEPIFSYVDFDCYVSATFYIIKTDRFDSKFLTGLLNSSLIRFWLKYKGKMQGNNYQIDKEPLINIPLIKITESNKPTADKIIALVEKILKAKEQNPQSPTQELESQIDSLVYILYNLTDEEIKTIENKE